jgi:deoxyribonuclease V
MRKQRLHEWNLKQDEAKALQRELAKQVIREDALDEVRYIAGVDMAINEISGMARAAVVLLSYPKLEVVEQHVYEEPLRMPYIPGLLSFRELPCILGAFYRLKQQPELVMVDGQGIAHPRRLGIASHLGLWLNVPSIGCAKSILVGHHAPLSEDAGSWVPLKDQEEVIGAVLRTRARVKPMIISLGHRISLETSLRFVLDCCKGYRLPEPTRLADKLSKDNAWSENKQAEIEQETLWQ